MDIILYNISVAIILLILSYLIGSIPNAIWIGKVFFHKDPRDYGSGNAGGTNAGRVFGKKIGVLVIFLDAIKLILPLYISWLILTRAPIYQGSSLCATVEETYYGINTHIIKWPIYWLTTIGCMIGHCYPIFAGFRGGKNAASFAGIILGASWSIGLLTAMVFFIVLKWKKYVSLGSILGSIFGSILSWIWAILLMTGVIPANMMWIVTYGICLDCSWLFALMVTLGSLLLIIRHIENIKRLKNGNERKITWMK